MRLFFLSTVTLSVIYGAELRAQQAFQRHYAHKVVVDSVLQTKAYTYLKVNERINEKDSLQWIAMPLFEPKPGDTYYFESGLQMGQFQSKELNRTFNKILFLGSMGTSPDISDKNIVPAPVIDTLALNATPPVVHTVVVKEVIQASGYTYLRVTEGEKEDWLAVVKIPASKGQIYTYDDAAPMTDFTSKELNRTFKEILFIASLTLVTDDKKGTEEKKNVKKKTSKKAKIITIANLFERKKSYSGKTVQINGKVTKYSSGILDKNWLHIEDGTDFDGKFDLTVTTDQEVKVGDTITVQGEITLNKDFGSGYFFDVIMEDAEIKN